ncbi:MAG: hypothetical protein KIT10_14695 [Flavobacteriales bacterium]|nr:hypothetical protein [Flavobacteriales bacterium]
MRAGIFLIACWLTLVPSSTGQNTAAPPSWTFGVSLATNANSELYSLFLVKEWGTQVIATEPITRSQFVLQAQGALESKANPKGENLFRKYGVTGCINPYDEERGVEDCGVFDDLWKLRFWEYPFHPRNGQHPGRGWSENRNAPSPRQMLLLSDYGILYLTGLARGEDAFRLLRDVGDSSWVENYRRGY